MARGLPGPRERGLCLGGLGISELIHIEENAVYFEVLNIGV